MTELSTQAGDAARTDRLPGLDPAPGRAWETRHQKAQLLRGLAEPGVAPGFLLGDAARSQAPHPAPSQRYLSNIPSPPSERSTTERRVISARRVTRRTWQIGILRPVLTCQTSPAGPSPPAALAAERSEPGALLRWAAPSRPIPSHPPPRAPAAPSLPAAAGGPPHSGGHRARSTPRGCARLLARHRRMEAGKSWHRRCPRAASRDRARRGGTGLQPAGPEECCSRHEGFNRLGCSARPRQGLQER